jgi:rabenosyn-5
MQDRQRVSGFARLYAALRKSQVEIEEAMGDFEAQMDILT